MIFLDIIIYIIYAEIHIKKKLYAPILNIILKLLPIIPKIVVNNMYS